MKTTHAALHLALAVHQAVYLCTYHSDNAV